MERILVDQNTKKTWSVKLQDASATISLNGGKPKSKTFKSNEEALNHVQKEMWKLLKKGYIYHNENADRLEPVLHRYIGRGYTGYLPIAPVRGTNSFYFAFVLGQFEQENIFHINIDGSIRLVSEMPPPSLTFDMAYSGLTNEIYINANHHLLCVNPETGALSRLSSEKDQHISMFSVTENRIAWIDGIMLRVTDRARDLVVWQKKLDIEEHKLHEYEICAGLSSNGQFLAYYSSQDSKIIVVDINTQEEIEIAKDSDSPVRKIFLSADNKTLFLQETTASWQIKYFNVERKDGWYRLPDAGEDTVLESSVNAEHTHIVVCTRSWIKVYDMFTKEELYRFKPENTLQYCNAAFLKNYIATYTDHGCVSFYKI